MSDFLLDTNVVVHSLSNDPNSNECRKLLSLLEIGAITAELDALVLHELTYTIPRYRKQLDKEGLVEFLLWLIDLPGVVCEKSLFRDALSVWGSTAGLGFVDSFLAIRATRDDQSVLTKNVREFQRLGISVPDPLPGVSEH